MTPQEAKELRDSFAEEKAVEILEAMEKAMNNETPKQAASYGEPWESSLKHDAIFTAACQTVAIQPDFDLAARAIQCVNACVGIADPEKAIQAAREALEQALSTTPSPCRCLRFSEPPHVCNICAALAQLNHTK